MQSRWAHAAVLSALLSAAIVQLVEQEPARPDTTRGGIR